MPLALQGGAWQAGQPDSLSGLGAAQVPAWGRDGSAEADPLARAQALLALTAAPRSMPCRDNERAAITAFVEEALTAGKISRHITIRPRGLWNPWTKE